VSYSCYTTFTTVQHSSITVKGTRMYLGSYESVSVLELE
jgi:hypothetical protein